MRKVEIMRERVNEKGRNSERKRQRQIEIVRERVNEKGRNSERKSQ